MPRYLVVANQTLAGEHLVEAVQQRVARGAARIHVLVPATAVGDLGFRTEGGAVSSARSRLDEALERFGRLGADEVTGEVGDERPLDAIRDVVRRESFDEIILSTLPSGASRWLGMDLPHRLERTVDIPVVHVEAAG